MTPGVQCWHHRKSKARAAAPGSCDLGRPRGRIPAKWSSGSPIRIRPIFMARVLARNRSPLSRNTRSAWPSSPVGAGKPARHGNRTPLASTASRPASRDDRERPSSWGGMHVNIILLWEMSSSSSFRGAPLGASPESITPVLVGVRCIHCRAISDFRLTPAAAYGFRVRSFHSRPGMTAEGDEMQAVV